MFSDQHHIEMIRDKLTKGNVSVMVGAGFSLNAKQLSKTKGSFLTWQKLIDVLKSKLYADEEQRKYASTDPLKLAEEFEFEFGREALEELLKLALPDDNYIPGELHEMLLTIPWSDIYTTNYDTLIERTREFVYSKHYSVIQTVQDIPNSIKPRIVKLHGSFPSHRPFIFTEEDYRTYPTKFSPFVNMVQQSIMENTLCLVGFSGEDPNFKKWIGWVKDNLGDYASSIYFCGFLNESQKRNLESKNIKVIDFTNLYNYSNLQKNHEYALKWFFLELLKPETYTPHKWPDANNLKLLSEWKVPKQVNEKLSYNENFIPIRQGLHDLYDYKDNEAQLKDINKIMNYWKEERERYPDWLIAPEKARNYIWSNTDHTLIQLLVDQKEKSTFTDYVNILYEFTWRLETGLLSLSIPRFRPLAPVIKEIIDDFISNKNDNKKFDDSLSISEKDFDALEDKLIHLCFVLVNYYRESIASDKIHKILSNFETIIFKNPEFIAEYYYQLCLLEISRFNYPKVRDLLKEWPLNYDIPYWEVRRASILIELKDYDQVEKILQSSLNDIRTRNIQGKDLELLSQESWILRILAGVKGRTDYSNLNNYVEREEITRKTSCDANRIYTEVITGVDWSLIKQQKKETVSFDPGMEIKSFSFDNNFDETFKNSFQIIKMVEDTGHRLKIKNTVFDKNRIYVACRYISEYDFDLSLNILVQLEDIKYIKAFLPRETIATLDSKVIENLFNNIYKALSYLDGQRIINQIDPFYDRRFSIMLEILSRLTIRLNVEQLDKCLDLAIKIYKTLSNSINTHTFSKELNNLFGRVLYAYDQNTIIKKLNELLKLPLMDKHLDMDPLDHVNIDLLKISNVNWEEIIDKSFADALIYKLESANSGSRPNIMLRLLIYHRFSLLSEEQLITIGAILVKSNFNYTRVYFHAIVNKFLIHDSSFQNPINKKTREILEQDFNAEKNTLIEMKLLLKDNDKCINFSYFKDSIQTLINNLDKWWNKNKTTLDRTRILQDFPWIIYKRFLNVLMYVTSVDKKLNSKVYNIIKDMETIDKQINSLLPIALYNGLTSQEKAEAALIDNLHSNEEKKVFDSIDGIGHWIYLTEQKMLPDLPSELISELVQKAFLRRAPHLEQALNVLIYLSKFKEFKFSFTQSEKLIDSLNNLFIETNISNFTEDNLGNLKKRELLPIRARACELASVLYQRMKNEDADIPESILEWKKESERSTTVPEIKKAWKTK